MTRGQVSGPLTLQLGGLHFERCVLVLHGLALLQHEHLERSGFRLRSVIGAAGRRDAQGAVVLLERNGRTLRRRVRSDGGYAAAHDFRVRFGLGPRAALGDVALAVIVEWPGGARERFDDLRTDMDVVLREGEGTLASQEPQS